MDRASSNYCVGPLLDELVDLSPSHMIPLPTSKGTFVSIPPIETEKIFDIDENLNSDSSIPTLIKVSSQDVPYIPPSSEQINENTPSLDVHFNDDTPTQRGTHSHHLKTIRSPFDLLPRVLQIMIISLF